MFFCFCRKTPSFSEPLPQNYDTCKHVIANLNQEQQAAIRKCLTANDYSLIMGMPGSGKTETIVGLVELLYALGMSVLITAHTNCAVDNVLLKLYARDIDFLRLGSSSKIDPRLLNKSEEQFQSTCTSADDLQRAISGQVKT